MRKNAIYADELDLAYMSAGMSSSGAHYMLLVRLVVANGRKLLQSLAVARLFNEKADILPDCRKGYIGKGLAPLDWRGKFMSQMRLKNSAATGELIPGYDYGKPASARSPMPLEELRQLEEAAGWTAEDAAVLASHPAIFADRAEAMVDSWRAVIASQPHLIKWFFGPDGKPDEQYMAKVKPRFVQWVRDVAMRPHDQAWLDYQEEIGLRHTPAKKNATDGAHTPDVVPLRYLVGMAGLIARSARKFFVEAGIGGDELERLQEAWTKAVMLHVSLWCRPYVKDGLW